MRLFAVFAMTAGCLLWGEHASARLQPSAAPQLYPLQPYSGLRQVGYENSGSPTPADGYYEGASGDCATGGCADGMCPGSTDPWAEDGYVDEYAGGYGDCGAGGYDAGLFTGGRCGPTWFGSLGFVYLTRDMPNPVWLTYPNWDPTGALLSTRDANPGWRGGFEVSFGRTLGCNLALQATYWMIDPIKSAGMVQSSTNELSTPLDFGTLNFGLDGFGNPDYVNNYFNNAYIHSVQRTNEFHNVEVNLLGGPFVSPCRACPRLALSWLTGFRYFRFREDLMWTSSLNNTYYPYDPANQAHYNIDVANSLIGWQVGGRADYCLCDRIRLFATPKVGIYGNYMTHQSQICRPDDVGAMNISSNKTDFSMMGQLDLGVDVRVFRCWSLYGGYRVLGISGVALSDNQIPHFIEDSMGISNIDSNGSLLLHGAFGGVQVCF